MSAPEPERAPAAWVVLALGAAVVVLAVIAVVLVVVQHDDPVEPPPIEPSGSVSPSTGSGSAD